MSLPPCLTHVDPAMIAAAWPLPGSADVIVAVIDDRFLCELHRIRAAEASLTVRELLARAGQANKVLVDAIRAMWPAAAAAVRLELVP